MIHTEEPRRTFLQTVALASFALSVGDTGAQAADGALLALKRELDQTHADLEKAMAGVAEDSSFEAEQAFDHALDHHLDVITRIESIPATTLDGMRVKLAALDRMYATEPGGLSIDSVAAEPTVDMRLIIQILDTLRGL